MSTKSEISSTLMAACVLKGSVFNEREGVQVEEGGEGALFQSGMEGVQPGAEGGSQVLKPSPRGSRARGNE